MAGAVIQAVDIQNTFGAAFVGLLLSAILYGVTIVQTWAYFLHHCERDTNAFKGFVAFLFTMDTAHLVLCIYTIYWYLILNFGNVEALEFNMWAMETQISVNTLVGYLIQLYYARRAFIMGKNIVLPLVIAFLGGICFTLGFVYTARTAVIGEFSHYGSALIWVTCVGLGSATLADILIAISMCWYLYHKRTGFSRTDSMIMTLMIYSINTGLLTSLLSSATLVSFSISPSTLISQVFFWPLSKCYFNSLLAMLNHRDAIRDRAVTVNTDSDFAMSSRFKAKTARAAVAVTVHRSATTDFTESKHDYGKEQCTSELRPSRTTTPSSVQEGNLEV